MSTLIDGTAIAATIRNEVKAEVDKLKAERGITPGLATVLIGDDPASATYVRSKHKACAEVGITSFGYVLPKETTQAEALALVKELAERKDVHGILTQVPFPKQISESVVLSHIPLEKDVDGFHPSSLGRLGIKNNQPLLQSCTPRGCIELLDRYKIPISGKRAVVLGRSEIVGLPVSLMLLSRDATVTICHSRTANLADVVREADIIIAAIGRAKFLTADMVKPGAAVIDVGINRVADPSTKSGHRLVGDVDFDAVAVVAGAITPVPGGVGPMTIAMLMRNTLLAAQNSAK